MQGEDNTDKTVEELQQGEEVPQVCKACNQRLLLPFRSTKDVGWLECCTTSICIAVLIAVSYPAGLCGGDPLLFFNYRLEL